MSKEAQQEQQVRDFFDKHAPAYKTKYGRTDTFYEYFFYERLHAATKEINFAKKRVLDIGAGTGSLYDFLQMNADVQEYTAVDISAGMMSQSNIPRQQQLVGRCYELDYPCDEYDLIYLLGVTTYFDPKECKRVFDFIQSKLSTGGMAILTFTNTAGLDIKLRKLSSYPAKLLKGSEKVMAQDFKTYTYTLKEVQQMLPEGLEKRRLIYLNHTIFPFGKILPGPSVAVAKRIAKRLSNGPLLSSLSSDFLIFLSKVN